MLYPNFENYVSLSTNHLEVGSHVKDVPPGVYLQKQKLFRHPLMRLPSALSGIPTTTRLLELPREILPSWNSLPVLDLLGLLTTEDALIHRGQKRIEDLLGCRPTPGTQDTRKWLCIDRPEEDP